MHSWKLRVPGAHLRLGLLYVASLVLLLWSLRTGIVPYRAIVETFRIIFGVIGLVAAFKASRNRKLGVRACLAWRAVAVSFAVLIASPAVPFVVKAAGDVTHLVFVASLLVALQLFPLARMTRRERWKLALDSMIVMVGGAMVLWYTAFGPYVHAHGFSSAVFVSVGLYPMCDLALLFTVARITMRGVGGPAQRPLRPLAAGALVLFAGDAVHGYMQSQLAMHSAVQFICWITGDALLAAAAVEQGRGLLRKTAERPTVNLNRYLPYAAVAVAHALVLWAAVKEGSFYPWGGLATGGAVLSALVLSRQILVQRESDQRSVTDGLTGLANRARFQATSSRALARGARTGQHSAILVIDMNEFKEVNDTLGHKSGDLVLIEFAKLLRRCVPASGLPTRMGGDEFAVVLPDLDFPEQAYDIAGKIAAAAGPVFIEGKLITLACSIGVAVSAPGELTHEQIVHRADLAMYAAKRLGPDTRWAAWRESFEEGELPAAA